MPRPAPGGPADLDLDMLEDMSTFRSIGPLPHLAGDWQDLMSLYGARGGVTLSREDRFVAHIVPASSATRLVVLRDEGWVLRWERLGNGGWEIVKQATADVDEVMRTIVSVVERRGG